MMTEQETWWADALAKANAERDAVQAEATLLRRALIGRRTFPAGVMRAPMDERTEAIRARWDEFCFSGPSETDRERDQVIGWLLDRMDSATARAEQAEAALAEFEHEVQWAHQVNSLDGTWNGDAVVQADEQTAHRTARIVGLAVRHGEFRVDVVCRDVWTRATDWRPADATPRTALERAADEQGVQLPADIDKLTAGADLQLSDDEFAEWTSAWQCTAPCCSEDAVEQGDDAREIVIGAGSPETSALTHCPTCGSPEWLGDGRRGWNPIDVECEVCAGTYNKQGDGEDGDAS